MSTPSEPAGWSRAEVIDKAAEAIWRAEFDNADQKPPCEWSQMGREDRRALWSMAEAALDVFAIMALAPPSSLDGGGANANPPRPADLEWLEQSRRQVSIGLTRIEHNERIDRILAALAAAPLPVGGE